MVENFKFSLGSWVRVSLRLSSITLGEYIVLYYIFALFFLSTFDFIRLKPKRQKCYSITQKNSLSSRRERKLSQSLPSYQITYLSEGKRWVEFFCCNISSIIRSILLRVSRLSFSLWRFCNFCLQNKFPILLWSSFLLLCFIKS